MSTDMVAIQARCPLCGASVLSSGRGGHVVEGALHPVPLGEDVTRGYTLCDDCGVLADLPANLTLN
ncbi:MAG: hypothetical protein A2V74_01800 [Acidobacteria bacterium RBG_16_70_10]|nr:MAG: hypothetical protein A2V74_01800 [Acidobacteria bacterium RBG_16_70_10]